MCPLANSPAMQIPNADVLPSSLQDILQSVCGVEAAITDQQEYTSNGGMIIGVISLVGDIEWSMILGLPSEAACVLASKFAGMEIPFDSSDMGDAIGELCNMTAGKAKSSLDQKGVKCDISLPNVMRAENMEFLTQQGTTVYLFHFESTAGKLWMGLMAAR